MKKAKQREREMETGRHTERGREGEKGGGREREREKEGEKEKQQKQKDRWSETHSSPRSYTSEPDKRQVSREEGEALARKWNLPFLEVNAKDGTNCDAVFETLAIEIGLRQIAVLPPKKEEKSQGCTTM
jgi:hypothetical protein